MSTTYRCGAPTKKGKPCQQRVAVEGKHCHRHQAAMANQKITLKIINDPIFNVDLTPPPPPPAPSSSIVEKLKNDPLFRDELVLPSTSTSSSPTIIIPLKMKHQCKGITQKGSRCLKQPIFGEEYCSLHLLHHNCNTHSNDRGDYFDVTFLAQVCVCGRDENKRKFTLREERNPWICFEFENPIHIDYVRFSYRYMLHQYRSRGECKLFLSDEAVDPKGLTEDMGIDPLKLDGRRIWNLPPEQFPVRFVYIYFPGSDEEKDLIVNSFDLHMKKTLICNYALDYQRGLQLMTALALIKRIEPESDEDIDTMMNLLKIPYSSKKWLYMARRLLLS